MMMIIIYYWTSYLLWPLRIYTVHRFRCNCYRKEWRKMIRFLRLWSRTSSHTNAKKKEEEPNNWNGATLSILFFFFFLILSTFRRLHGRAFIKMYNTCLTQNRAPLMSHKEQCAIKTEKKPKEQKMFFNTMKIYAAMLTVNRTRFSASCLFFFILSSSPLLFSDGNIPSECFIWIFFFFCCFHVFVCRLMRQLTFNTCVTLAAPIRLPLLARTRSLHTKAQLNVSFSFFSNDSNKYVDVDETRSMWANWMEWICVVHVSLCDMSNVLQCTPPRYGARIVVIECGTVAWD